MPCGQDGAFDNRVRAWLIGLGVLLCGPPVVASAACEAAQPESILVCLQRAYASRDSATYAELLSDDFLLYNYGPDSTSWDRDVSRKAAADLFKRTVSLRLEILGWKLHPGEASHTWILDSLDAKVTIVTTSAGNHPPVEMLSKDNTLYLRSLPGPKERIVIYKWVRPRPDGKERK
jgi:hypothetical protein